MLVESIALAIFVISFGGAIFLLAKKAPVLATMPKNGSSGIRKNKIVSDVESKVKDFFLAIEKQIFLHKILSWVKCLTLKIETRIDTLLHNIRKKAQKIDRESKEKK